MSEQKSTKTKSHKSPINKRLASFVESLNIDVKAFEIQTGLSNGFVNNVGDSIRTSSLDKISKAHPTLNTSWLLTGEGQMLKSDKQVSKTTEDSDSNDNSKNTLRLIQPPTSNKETKSDIAVPVFDVNFSAGTLLNLVELRDMQYPIAWLNIPEVAGCDAVIRARGNSMEPVIRDGDWIAIKQETHWQEWLPKNYIYAISTSTMMLIKYISEISDTHFTIASANEFYKDDVIPKKFVHDVWSVKTVLPFSQIVTLV